MSDKNNIENQTECTIFLKNLSYLRQKHNLTPTQMAKILGIGIASWSKIEQGMMPPHLSARVVLTAAEVFGIPAARLFSDIIES